jgi:RNA 2',3'-cyclic 3'-phosphodiesterase
VARLFFAVASPADVAASVGLTQRRLRDAMGAVKASWPRPEHAHCTLKFLGELPAERAEAAICAASELKRTERAFRLTLEGVGAFPDARRPQVLWLGVTTGAPELTRLATSLDRCLQLSGFDREERPYVPHLTLARIKFRGAEKPAAHALATVKDMGPVATWEVRSFALFESVSTSEGVRYTAIETFDLEAR